MFFSPSPPETLITNGVLVVIVLPGSYSFRGHVWQLFLGAQTMAEKSRPCLGPVPEPTSQSGCRQGWGNSWAPAPGEEVARTSVAPAQHPTAHSEDPSSWEPPNKSPH